MSEQDDSRVDNELAPADDAESIAQDGVGEGDDTQDTTNEPEIPKEVHAKLARLERELSEERQKSRGWYEHAQELKGQIDGAGKPAKATKVEDDAEVEDAVSKEELIRAIADGGPKQFRKVLKKMGMFSAEDVAELVDAQVEAKVNGRLGPLVAVAKLQGEYPELNDKESELSKAAYALYQELQDHPLYKDDHEEALRVSVERAQLNMLRAQAKNGSAASAKDAKEAERQARVAAQAGTAGKRSAGNQGTIQINARQLEAAAKLGVTEEQLRKQIARTQGRAR